MVVALTYLYYCLTCLNFKEIAKYGKLTGSNLQPHPAIGQEPCLICLVTLLLSTRPLYPRVIDYILARDSKVSSSPASVLIVNLIASTFQKGQRALVYRDVSEAFGRIPHQRLTSESRYLRLLNPFYSAISCYQTQRFQVVPVDFLPLTNGFMQDGIYDTFLFLEN